MNQATAVCESCGATLDPQDEPKDLAHVVDPRHLCSACHLLLCPAPTPTRPVNPAFRDRARSA
jgi:hypothetical protein